MVSTAGEGGDARARASGVAGAARAQLGRGHGGGEPRDVVAAPRREEDDRGVAHPR